MIQFACAHNFLSWQALIVYALFTISQVMSVPFLRNFHWGGKTAGGGANMSCQGLANARV